MDKSMPTRPGGRPARPSERVDEVCDRFEAEWRAGRAPRIEDFLAEAAEADRPALLGELVALERELRRRRGERPGAQEYLDRFPSHADTVRAAFGAARHPGGGAAAPPEGDTGRNLLFGILALQNNFIGRDDLLGAFAAWVADKTRPLAQLLVDRGALDAARRALLEALVAEHLKQHGGDTEASLAAVSSLGSVHDDLERLGDADLQASLAATTSRAAGTDADAGATATDTSSSRRAGARFRILRFHREGGLGRVYVARDEELGREVALKEIRPDRAAAADLRGRFVLEAEINGGLEHPGIVPIYSLGTYEDGLPFYAMRFVEGDSLKEAIESYHKACPRPDPNAVEFRKLLSRFIDVCEAIAFAHSKGVLHRDLKPHNVMLGRYGETLLIDWGLAKATGRREPVGSDAMIEATLVPPSGSGHAATVGVLGSPPYMSPEQAAGAVEALGPATDIYGLGAILFALLTGEPPVEGGAIEEVLNRARGGVIRSPRSLNPNVPRALEAICLKALAFNPEGRYPSARALADDVERWLADEPVSAWREPLVLRARRWTRRRRTLVMAASASAAVAVVALGASTALLSQANGRIRRQERIAQENLDESRRFVAMMFEKVVDRLHDVRAMDDVQREILERGLGFYSDFVRRRSNDPAVRHEIGRAYMQMGDIQARLHRAPAAEASYRQGLGMLEALTTEYPTVSEYGRSLSRVLAMMGRLYRHTNRVGEAEHAARRALAIDEKLDRGPSADDRSRRTLALSHYDLAMLYDHSNRPKEAEQSYRRALSIQEDLVARDPEKVESRSELGQSLYELGYLLDRRGQLDLALPMYERLVAIQERLVRERPASVDFRSSVTGSLSYYAGMLGRVGRFVEAERAHHRAIEIEQELVEEHPDIIVYQMNLAMHYGNLGNHWRRSARPDEAERWHRKALEIMEKLARDHPDRIDYAVSAAHARSCIGEVQWGRGHYEEAIAWLDQSIPLLRSIIRAAPEKATARHRLSEALSLRALSLHASARDAEALADLRESAELTGEKGHAVVRALHARFLARAADPAAVSDEAGAVEADTAVPPSDYGEALYHAAAANAILASRGPSPVDLYVSRAMNLLNRARGCGYFKTPEECAGPASDHDFDPLRRRLDFQTFVADLTFPTNPF